MSTIKFADFQKLDIRIGTVTKAEIPKWSHWVIRLTVDFSGGIASEAKSAKDRSSRRVRKEPGSREVRPGGGDEIGLRTIYAGLLGFYESKDLEGKQFPFIVNLEPKKIGPNGDYSQGMMLAGVEKLDKPVKVVDEETDEKPVLLTLSEKVPNGTKVR